jgi:outer membrane protein
MTLLTQTMQISLPKTQTPLWVVLAALFLPLMSSAQNNPPDSTLQTATLEKVVQYALTHQPAVRQAMLDEKITNNVIRGKLADWYPQINYVFNYQHTYDLNVFILPTGAVRTGLHNNSSQQLTATQNIFNRDALLASKSASTVRTQAAQNTQRSKVDVTVNVSKAFYDVLATTQQIKVSEESIIRLRRSLKDAQSRYNAGLTDKTDYKRATIQLGNAEAQLKSNVEMLKYKEAYLKTLMGYPVTQPLPVQYDTLQMENEILVDTMQEVNYAQNIDYRILSTQRELQDANLKYSYWAFLPTITATGAYNYNYFNNKYSELYHQGYANSYVVGTFTLPLFQGGKRIARIKEQHYTRDRLDVAIGNFKQQLSTEYTRSLASYKSNLANYLTQKENVMLATEVYDVIQLQYLNGVKTYLDVTIAESDLRTTRINYFNALYAVLASKLDIQRALGQINY